MSSVMGRRSLEAALPHGALTAREAAAWRSGDVTARPAIVTGAGDFAMVKGVIAGLTRVASQEWARYGIVVNTIYPVVRTEPCDRTLEMSAAADRLADTIPVRRFGGPYEDCAPILVFLAGEGAGYLNGQAIAIDGGLAILA